MAHPTTEQTIGHGIVEKLCPRCFDFRPGSVKEHAVSDVAGWFCPACDYAAPPDEVPHDVDEYDEYVERGIINEERL